MVWSEEDAAAETQAAEAAETQAAEDGDGEDDDLFLQEEEDARAAGALMAVEWPERLGLDLPEAWCLELRHQGEGRLAQLTEPKKAST